MKFEIFRTSAAGNSAAAQCLIDWLLHPDTRNVMLAAGNTPLDLYRRIAALALPLAHLNLFALDEYVGVPEDEPRTCGNLLRCEVAETWRVPAAQFFALSPLERGAEASVREAERRLAETGGLDVLVLGLGINGHLGFNEPGSACDSTGRVVELEPSSVESNRAWFAGKYAPARGVTFGLKMLLSSRRILIMAYGPTKTAAAKSMISGPQSERCPASFLQSHPDVRVFLDEAAAGRA